MLRQVGGVAVAGLLLAACGTAATTTVAETTSATAGESTTTTATEPATTDGWEQFTVTGEGLEPELVDFTVPEDEPAAVRVVYDGADMLFGFVVYTDDPEYSRTLVGTVGPYDGVVPVNFGEAVRQLATVVEGAWSLTVMPLSDLPTFDDTFTGHGDQVVVYTGDGDVFGFVGEGSFEVVGWEDVGAVIAVTSGGDWTLAG